MNAKRVLIAQPVHNGANPNLVSDTGRTPLEIVEAIDYEEIIGLPRKHGAKE